MKKLAKVFAVLAAVLLLFALLVGALYRIFTDKEWVRNEYERIDIEAQSGYTAEEATYVLGSMMDYSMGFLDDLDKVSVYEGVLFFNESELSHMVDVRELTTSVMRLGLIALIVGFALYTVSFLILKREGLFFFSKAFLIVLGVLILFIAAIGIWMAVDFNSFWRAFHAVFLDLESSYFNWNESQMIRICPAELFSDFIKHFALIAGMGLIVPIVLSILFLCLRKSFARDENTPHFSVVWMFDVIVFICLLIGLLTDIQSFRTIGFIGLLGVNVINIINNKNG